MKTLLTALKFARHLWPYYIGVTIASILVALTGIAVPFVLGETTTVMVDAASGNSVSLQYALLLAFLLFGFDVANAVIRNYGGYLGDVMSARIKEQLSNRYYQHLLTLPQQYFDGELSGTIINRLNRAINEVSNFVNVFANNFFPMILTVVVSVVIIFTYSWELAILVFLIYPLFLWLTTMTSKKWQVLQNKKNHHTDIASGRFAEVVTQIKVVKSYNQQKRELRSFGYHFLQTVGLTRKQSKYWHGMDTLRGGVLSIAFFAIFAYIFTQTVQQRFSVGDMVLLVTLINALRQPLFSMSFIVDQFQRAITGSKDFVQAMSEDPERGDKRGLARLSVGDGLLEYKNVSFGYKKGKPIVSGISFTARPGQKIALVGESGQGKTTLANLLMRLYEPDSGQILIDGQSIANVTQKSLRRSIATVFQDPSLFSGTIRENIAYARPGATDEEVISAAKMANAHDFVSKLEKGYDTEIGERGVRLSGGQKQRLAIARAILKDAPILILDEATSSLDSKAEHLVQEALDTLMRGRTTLIIAHRLSTIAHVDQIITMKNGSVDERGAPLELAETGGIYSQLLKLQMGTTEAAKKKLKNFDIAQ